MRESVSLNGACGALGPDYETIVDNFGNGGYEREIGNAEQGRLNNVFSGIILEKLKSAIKPQSIWELEKFSNVDGLYIHKGDDILNIDGNGHIANKDYMYIHQYHSRKLRTSITEGKKSNYNNIISSHSLYEESMFLLTSALIKEFKEQISYLRRKSKQPIELRILAIQLTSMMYDPTTLFPIRGLMSRVCTIIPDA